jgi:hypothetical protein
MWTEPGSQNHLEKGKGPFDQVQMDWVTCSTWYERIVFKVRIFGIAATARPNFQRPLYEGAPILTRYWTVHGAHAPFERLLWWLQFTMKLVCPGYDVRSSQAGHHRSLHTSILINFAA